MDQPLLARKVRVETNLRCDFDNGIIPIGKYATIVTNATKANGKYHGRICFEQAFAHVEELEKENIDL